MTTSAYLRQITNGDLVLIDDSPSSTDTLSTGEYFCLMFFTEYKSYLRNYVHYRNQFNYNEDFDCFDIDIWKQNSDDGYFISTDFNKLNKPDKGRVITVTTTDITKCVLLD